MILLGRGLGAEEIGLQAISKWAYAGLFGAAAVVGGIGAFSLIGVGVKGLHARGELELALAFRHVLADAQSIEALASQGDAKPSLIQFQISQKQLHLNNVLRSVARNEASSRLSGGSAKDFSQLLEAGKILAAESKPGKTAAWRAQLDRVSTLAKRLEATLQTLGMAGLSSATSQAGFGTILILAAALGLLASSAGMTRAAQRRARQKVAEMAERLSDVQRRFQLIELTVDAALGAGSAREAVDEAAESLRRLLGWSLSHVLIPDSNGAWVSSKNWLGDEESNAHFCRSTAAVPIMNGFDGPGRAAETGEPYWLESFDLSTSSQRSRMCPMHGLQTSLSIPVQAGGETVAVIELLDNRLHLADPSLIRILDHLQFQLDEMYEREAAERTIWEQQQALLAQSLELQAKQETLDKQERRLEEQRKALKASEKALAGKERKLTETFDELTRASQMAKHSRDMHEMAARRFEELFNGVPVACFTCDGDGVTFEWNRCAEQLWGIPAYEAVQKPVLDIVSTSETRQMLEELQDRVFRGETVEQLELQTNNMEGKSIWAVVNAFPVRTPSGEITGTVWSFMDTTERKNQEDLLRQAMAKLESIATTDGLTGLKNHRSFQEFLELQFQMSQRYGQPLSTILMDVDFFKQYNDQFGHPAGDEVLRRVAAVAQESCRAVDFVARYGGEEFVVVLPNTDKKGVLDAAERLRAAIEREEWPNRAITISVGCATSDPAMQSRAELVAVADRALYASKAAGRNRVTHADALRNAA